MGFSLYERHSQNTIVSKEDNFLVSLPPEQRKADRRLEPKFLSGWRVGALLSLVGAASIFLINITLISWVSRKPTSESGDSTRTLWKGSCSHVRQLNVWIHLLVNMCSTLLLCGSNYCMQVLVAPNREELDLAHKNRRWLHIGVPNFHNLKHIPRDRLFLWMLLMLSSIPLHLLYNSVVFTNLQANNYAVIPTQEDWLHGAPYDFNGFIGFKKEELPQQFPLSGYVPKLSETTMLSNGTIVARYKNVSTADCFKLYDNQYTYEVGNVYLVQSNHTTWRNQMIWKFGVHEDSGEFKWFQLTRELGYTLDNTEPAFPFISRPGSFPSNKWRCRSHRASMCNVQDPNEVPQDRSQWTPYESPLRYCIVEQVPQICQLQLNLFLAGLVSAANFIKVVSMALLLVRYNKHEALVTLGDAVSSFLDRPDPEMRYRCLQSTSEFGSHWRAAHRRIKHSKSQAVFEIIGPQRYNPRRHRWAHSPSDGRWIATYSFFLIAVAFGIVICIAALRDMPRSLPELWAIGFGGIDGRNLLGIKISVMGAILLANSPQFLLSYLYLTFNALYTAMFIGYEWSAYFKERKPLRVTAPVGQQRSSYWLSVPFRFAIPVTILSGLFHWMASQSLFLVQITVTDLKTRKISDGEKISTCGYSPLGAILTIVTAAVLALVGLLMGMKRYPAGMPLAASCSAAISAACHPHADDVDASLRPVQWGAVTHGVRRNGVKPVGHCTFSSFPVEPPIPGRLYA